MNYATQVLAQLDQAVQLKVNRETLKKINDQLVNILRKNNSPDPDWASFPVGRTFFTQQFA